MVFQKALNKLVLLDHWCSAADWWKDFKTLSVNEMCTGSWSIFVGNDNTSHSDEQVDKLLKAPVVLFFFFVNLTLKCEHSSVQLQFHVLEHGHGVCEVKLSQVVLCLKFAFIHSVHASRWQHDSSFTWDTATMSVCDSWNWDFLTSNPNDLLKWFPQTNVSDCYSSHWTNETPIKSCPIIRRRSCNDRVQPNIMSSISTIQKRQQVWEEMSILQVSLRYYDILFCPSVCMMIALQRTVQELMACYINSCDSHMPCGFVGILCYKSISDWR